MVTGDIGPTGTLHLFAVGILEHTLIGGMANGKDSARR